MLVSVAGGTLLSFISTSNRKGAIVNTAILLARNAIPSIIVSITIIVTLNDLFLLLFHTDR